jgi:hypothetical protein
MDGGFVGAAVDGRRGDPDLQRLSVAPDQLGATGPRLDEHVDDRPVAVGFDDAGETA